MRDLRQIIRDNGDDNTPIGDSHNLTGRAKPMEQLFSDIERFINDARRENGQTRKG